MTKRTMTDPIELTLAAIKPPHSHKGHVVSEIIRMAANAGLHPVKMWMGELNTYQWNAFYAQHRKKEFFPGLIKHMMTGPSIFIVLRGPDAQTVWRDTMVEVREKFSEGGPANAVHGSDHQVAFDREYGLVFGHLT